MVAKHKVKDTMLRVRATYWVLGGGRSSSAKVNIVHRVCAFFWKVITKSSCAGTILGFRRCATPPRLQEDPDAVDVLWCALNVFGGDLTLSTLIEARTKHAKGLIISWLDWQRYQGGESRLHGVSLCT